MDTEFTPSNRDLLCCSFVHWTDFGKAFPKDLVGTGSIVSCSAESLAVTIEYADSIADLVCVCKVLSSLT